MVTNASKYRRASIASIAGIGDARAEWTSATTALMARPSARGHLATTSHSRIQARFQTPAPATINTTQSPRPAWTDGARPMSNAAVRGAPAPRVARHNAAIESPNTP